MHLLRNLTSTVIGPLGSAPETFYLGDTADCVVFPSKHTTLFACCCSSRPAGCCSPLEPLFPAGVSLEGHKSAFRMSPLSTEMPYCTAMVLQ